ncbi:MAG: hypothetical protein AB1720_08595 [Pseudomonadota bacterium]
MALAVVSFAGAFWLGSGDLAGFALVCVASGLALGADLALPLLDAASYRPGGTDTAALSATYALLPCVIKLAALAWFRAQRPRLQPGVCPC